MIPRHMITDKDLMPFGKHKGKKIADVPPSYLLWLYDQDLEEGGIKDYIERVGVETLELEKLDEVRRWN